MANQFSTRQRDSVHTGYPRKYKVIFHNDDFTTMDFVVKVLRDVFFKSESEAFVLMMKVHKEGQACVGSYSYDIALSKRERAVSMAREEGFPLKLSIEVDE